RQLEAAEAIGGFRCGQERRCIGADRGEPGDPDVEEPRLSTLQIEAEAEDCVDQRGGQEERGVAQEVEHQSRVPKRPVGFTSSTAIRIKKAIAARNSAPAKCTAPD